MRGSCSPGEPVDDRRPPKRVAICTKRCGSSVTLPMRAARPSGCARIAPARAGRPRARDGHHLPSLATYSGSSPSSSQARHLRQHREWRPRQQHAAAGLARDLVERGRQPAARGVAQRVHRPSGTAAASAPPDRAGRGVGDDGRFRRPATRAATAPPRRGRRGAGDQHRVARLRPRAADAPPGRHHADAGGGDEHAVALARSTTLVSPVTTGTPASREGRPSTRRCFFRSASGKPSSRMKLADRYSGWRPAIATSFTVPCTERQPMSPPGKKRRGRPRGRRSPSPACPAGTGEQRAVVALAQELVVEGARTVRPISCAIARPPAPCRRGRLKSTGRT